MRLDILKYICDICIYYYKSFNKKILNKTVNIPEGMYNNILDSIYKTYLTSTNGYVYDIMIMDFPFEGYFIIDNVINIDIKKAYEIVDEYIDNSFYANLVSPAIISIRSNPVENFVIFDFEWIKRIVDLYVY